MCYYVTKNRLLFTNHFKFQTNVKLIYVGTMHSAMWNKVCRSCKVVSFFHHSWFMWESGYLNFLLSVSGLRNTWRNTYRCEIRRLQNLRIFFLSIERISHIFLNHIEFATYRFFDQNSNCFISNYVDYFQILSLSFRVNTIPSCIYKLYWL